MSRGSIHYVSGVQLCDAAFPPDGWWLDFPGCGRYASTPTTNRKNIAPWEIDRAADLDHGFMWFAEQSEVTPINSTLDDDIRLAEQSAAMAESYGLPAGGPHMFAVDTDGRRYMDQVRAAFVTYRQRVPQKWPLWVYGGSDVIDQLVADGTVEGGHIPGALSWSSTSRPVDNVEVFQTPGGLRWYRSPSAFMLQHPSEAYRGGRIDRNDICPGKQVPLWYPGRTEPTPPPIVVQEDEDMALARQAPDGSYWLALIAPDGNPALVPTAGEGWYVFGVLGYRTDGTGPPVPTIDGDTFSAARKLSQEEWDALARQYGGSGGVAAHHHEVAGGTGPAVPG